jgi:hypothetical protein
MTRPELRVFLQEWFCGCGSPESAAARLRDLLALHPLYDHRPEIERLLPDVGIQELVLYTLDYFDLTDHGGTVGGGWLTDKGRAVLDALNRETADSYETLMAQSCCHGYAVDDELMECPECSKLNQK